MNIKAQKNLLKTIDRKKLRYERVFYKQIRKVLHKQTMTAIDYILFTGNTDLNVNVFFKSSDLQKVFVRLYKTVGLDFAEWQHKRLKSGNKEYRIKQDEQLISFWEEEMLKYATQAGGRISSITSTNAVLFKRELTKILGQATQEGLGVEDITRLIQKDLIKNISKQQIWQSRRIAQTEVLSAANKGQFVSAEKAGILMIKVWMTLLDSHTRDAHITADNQSRSMDSPFSVGGEFLQHPGDVNGSPENVINCRCAVDYVPAEDNEGFAIGV